MGADNDTIPVVDLGPDLAPMQLAAIQVKDLAADLAAAEGVVGRDKVAPRDATRRDEATTRLVIPRAAAAVVA